MANLPIPPIQPSKVPRYERMNNMRFPPLLKNVDQHVKAASTAQAQIREQEFRAAYDRMVRAGMARNTENIFRGIEDAALVGVGMVKAEAVNPFFGPFERATDSSRRSPELVGAAAARTARADLQRETDRWLSSEPKKSDVVRTLWRG